MERKKPFMSVLAELDGNMLATDDNIDADGQSLPQDPLMEPASLVEDLKANLRLHSPEDFLVVTEEGQHYAVFIDSLGDAESAAAYLGCEVSEVDDCLAELVSEIKAEANLPAGELKFSQDEDGNYVFMFTFEEDDLSVLSEAGFVLGEEAEPSFDEIIATLAAEGHSDIAERLYEALYLQEH